MAVTRRRDIPIEGFSSSKSRWVTEVATGGGGIPPITVRDPASTYNAFAAQSVTFKGSQETTSEAHPGWRNSAGDQGGDFTTSRQFAIYPARDVRIQSDWFASGADPRKINRATYYGPYYTPLGSPVPSFPPFGNSTDSGLNVWGTKAIALCAPTNPTANMATAVLEAWKDGLPSLLGHSTWAQRTSSAQKAGDEYLNVQFGWLPLTSDIKDFVRGVMHLDGLIKQYLRDSGKVVRRSWSFPEETSMSTVVQAAHAYVGGPFDNEGSLQQVGGIAPGSVSRTRISSVRRWFSGAFTYHAPASLFYGRSAWAWQEGKIQAAIKVLGLDPSPDTLWELAPWSWAIDWFSDAGDVIHNLNAWKADGLVLKYGYIMEHSIVRDIYHFEGPLGFRPEVKWTSRPADAMLISERKLRRRATPFGFGFDMSALTSRQKAIVAALGLSRLR